MANLKQAMIHQQLSDENKKRQYAQLYEKLGDRFKAAFQLFPNDTKLAIQVANEWPQDQVVIDFQNEKLLTRDTTDNLPTKADLARKVWDRMNEPLTSDEDFVKMAKTYAEVMGYIEKPGTQVNVQNVSNKVMIVREKESDDDWARGLAEQQANLISQSN